MKFHTASRIGFLALGLVASALAQTAPSGLTVNTYLEQHAHQNTGTSTMPGTLWFDQSQIAPTGVLGASGMPTSFTVGPLHGSPVTVELKPGINSDRLNAHGLFYYTFVGEGDPALYLEYAAFDLTAAQGPFSLTAVWHGGTFDGFTTVNDADPLLLPAQPLFSADTFTALANGSFLDFPSYQLEFSAFTPRDGVSNAQREVYVAVNGHETIYTPLKQPENTYTIETGAITTADRLLVRLTDSYVAEGQTYRTTTSMYFASIPEPSTYAALDGAAALVVAVASRRRR